MRSAGEKALLDPRKGGLVASFDPAVTKTLLFEGGQTNDPKDPGGLTRFGIAQKFHPDINVATLTLEEAKDIYKKEYWSPLSADVIQSQAVAEMLFDAAVNIGVKTTANLIQTILGVPCVGVMDVTTLNSLNACTEQEFAAAFTLAKIARYVSLCLKEPVKKKFFFGWVKRALEGKA